jgi:hypothetical protein
MTQLFCAIPTCRIPGEHRPLCDGDCRYGCQPRLAEDGYVCDSCVGYDHQLLGVIADLAPDARAVAAGQARPGATRNGGSSNKPGSQSPLNDGATDALGEITAELTKIARRIATVRGLRGPQSHTEGRTPGDPLGTLCSWLSDNLGWVRHAVDDHGQPYAVTVHAAIRDAANRIRAIVNGPHARRYLGPCGTNTPKCKICQATDIDHHRECDVTCPHKFVPGPECDGDVYGRPGATHATCRTCNAQHAQHDRRTWIDGLTADLAAPARDIAHAHGIPVKTIRTWANEIRTDSGTVIRPAKLRTYWRDGTNVVPWEPRPDTLSDHDWRQETTRRGPRLHFVGDVLTLARQAAERRATRQQELTTRDLESTM